MSMSADKFAGHTPGPWSLRKDEHGLFMVAWHGMVIAQFIDKSNAEPIRAAPELLAENERLRNRVAELEALATDAYLAGSAGL